MTKFEKIMDEEMKKEAMTTLLGLPQTGKGCKVSFICEKGSVEAKTTINGDVLDVIVGIQRIVKGVAETTNCEVKEVYEYLMKTAY